MKRFLFFVGLALVGGFMLMLEGCGDNPNPCTALKPVSAAFKFQESFYEIDSLFETDTVFTGSKVTFTATEADAIYKWKVGDDPNVFVKKSFSLDFGQPYGKVETSLIVNKQPNKTCFPSDDGADTIKRNLYVIPKIKNAFLGTFTGYDTNNPNEIFDVTIIDFGVRPNPDFDNPPKHYGLRIFNFPKGCGNNNISSVEHTPSIDQSTYRHFKIIPDDVITTQCGATPGLGRVFDNNNKMVITFLGYDKQKNRLYSTDRKFIGTRKK